jgi:predicted nucleotidyltransferase
VASHLQQLLEVLYDSGFEFIVVGGTAALAHGAVTPTRDVDVAAPMTEENLSKLMDALRPHHPKHATRPDLGVIPHSVAELSKFRLLLIDTDIGRLDVLAGVKPLGEYAELASCSMELLEGKSFRVLELDSLIEVKAFLQRPKDKIVEAELRAIRDRLRNSSA